MKRLLSLAAVVLLHLHAQPGLGAQPEAQGIEFFEKKIRPALVQHCYACHSAEAQQAKKLKGGLLLDSRAGVLKGGDSGPALVPGKPKESLLIKALHYSDDLRMPPKAKLAQDVIAEFEKWIALGAPDPRDGKAVVARKGIDLEAGRRHWAFQPLQVVAPPALKAPERARTALDQFLLARLEQKGLTFNPPVNQEKLIRRAYYDLWGLPPSPADIDAFVQDPAPDAYSQLIDRLLASPHYGERWARHWLDVARFAESGGYEFDGDRPGAYLYRDFVIKALNEDLPYDEFVRLQIAGDLLRPGDFLAATATGFVVAGPFPGQITAKTRERIRYDHLDDMLSTAGNALLGLSLGCARCHDHKYDPIPQEDYYRLLACLGRTDSVKAKLDPDVEATRRAKAEFDRAHIPLTAALEKHTKEQLPATLSAWAAAERGKPAPAWLILDPVSAAGKAPLKKEADGSLLATGKADAIDTYTIVAQTQQKGITALRLEALLDDSLPGKGPGRGPGGDFYLTGITLTAAPASDKMKAAPVKLRNARATFEAPGRPIAAALVGDKKSGWSIGGQSGRNQAAIVETETPVGFDGGTVLTLVLKFEGNGFALGRLRLAIGAAPAAFDAPAAPQAGREVLRLLDEQKGQLTDANRAAIGKWFAPFDRELRRLVDAVEEHARQEPQPKLTDAFIAGNVNPDAVYLLARGEVERKTGLAKPGFAQLLLNVADERWVSGAEPRIALARWLTDAEAGAGQLLARVLVNRLWQHHLGRGLVATPNDFGSQGERASHPELLDYLASELLKNGWRLKALHRLIMTSAVYMEGGELTDAAMRGDPQNLLWWRRPPRRLEAEVIRDALLAVSGALDPRLYGPGTLDENNPRRSVYLTVKRSQLVPFLQLFDAPEAIQSVGVRSTTTVATQALAMMNSPFVRQRAEQLAQRLRPQSAASLSQAIEEAYRTALGRRPSDSEGQRMAAFLTGQMQNGRTLEQALADGCQLLLCLNEFIYVD